MTGRAYRAIKGGLAPGTKHTEPHKTGSGTMGDLEKRPVLRVDLGRDKDLREAFRVDEDRDKVLRQRAMAVFQAEDTVTGWVERVFNDERLSLNERLYVIVQLSMLSARRKTQSYISNKIMGMLASMLATDEGHADKEVDHE